MSETMENTETTEATTEERKRRRLRPNEVAMLKRYLAYAVPGETIAFSDLPDIDMKRALFPSSQLRLVEKELLKPTYNEDTGLLETVTIDEDMLKAYEWDLKAPEPKTVVKQRDPDEVRTRRVRGSLNNDNYRIQKLVIDKNPKRDGTHGWYNWNLCYWDGQSIPQYLSYLDYDRNIKVSGKYGVTWFNGPDTLYLYSDFKNGYIGIYDATKDKDDPEYWLKPETVFSKDEMDSANGEDRMAELEASASAEAEAENPVVSESGQTMPG